MNRNGNRLMRAVGLACVAGTALGAGGAARGQLIAYDGFAYPQGAPLTLAPLGGVGWSGGWNVASPGDWTVDSQGSSYSSGFRTLVRGGLRIHGSTAGTQRTMLGTTLGSAAGTETVWVSFIGQQAYGSWASNWLGVKLPCVSAAGVNSFLFLGKPYGKQFWGMDAGSIPSHRVGTRSPYQKSFIVARIDLRPGLDDVRLWVNPGLAGAPSNATASVTSLGYGNFEGITKAITEVGATSGLTTGHIDELRIGREFGDVAPRRPGFLFHGHQAGPMGQALLENTSPDMLTVSNIGGTGNDGVEVSMGSLAGTAVVVRPEEMPAGGSLTVAGRNWEGEGLGSVTWRRVGDEHQMACDYTGRAGPAVTSVRIRVYDESGSLVQDETTPGPSALATINAAVGGSGNSGLCSDGLPPRWYLDDGMSPFGEGVTVRSVFGCPNDVPWPAGNSRSVLVNAAVACDNCPAVGGGPGVNTSGITASGLGSFRLEGAATQVGETMVTGLGEAVVSQSCDDGSACSDPQTQRMDVDNLGGTGQDGIQWPFHTRATVADGTEMSYQLGGLSSLAASDAGQVAMSFDVRMPSGDARRITTYMERTPDNRLLMTVDAGEMGDVQLGVTVSNDGTPVGGGQGSYRSIRVYVDGMLEYVTESSFLAWFYITHFAYLLSPPPGTPNPTFTVDTGNGASAMVGNELSFQVLDAGAPLAVTGGAVTGRDLSGAISVSQLMFHKAPSCPADFNQDGFLDFFDYDGFVGAFESGGPGADFNQDGFLDFFDYDGFVQAFEVGC